MVDGRRLPIRFNCHHFDFSDNRIDHEIATLISLEGRLRFVSRWVERDGQRVGVALTAEIGSFFRGTLDYSGYKDPVLALMTATGTHHWEMHLSGFLWEAPIFLVALKPRRRRR